MASATRGRAHVFKDKPVRTRVDPSLVEEGLSEYQEKKAKLRTKLPRKKA